MPNLLREPLLHFFIAGALLFALHAAVAGPATQPEGEVHLTEGEVRWLEQIFTRQRQRPPSEAELRGLVAEYLKEQLLAQEARALGLDRDDTIVRRRLAQKLEFLVQDTARVADPTDAELQARYAADPARYSEPTRLTLSFITFSGARRADPAADAAAALAAAKPGATPRDPGDPTLVEPRLDSIDHLEVAQRFGAPFADAVFALAPGAWHGPLLSGYGAHLVRIEDRSEGAPLPFEQVRDRVAEDWRQAREAVAAAELLAELRARYRVTADASVVARVGDPATLPLDAPAKPSVPAAATAP